MIKIFLCVVMLAMGWQQAYGFSLLGPSVGPDAYQIPDIGYNIPGYDLGGPKMIGQGYRRNAPVVFYGYDQSFLTFFGPDGTNAVDSAFGIMNALPAADSIQLSQYPFNSQQSYDASALYLSDLKSWTLGALVEQMGLAPSVRYVWTLHDRFIPPGASCSTNPAANGTEYLVVQRNIDPVSQVYSSYVNGTLYSYLLEESCGNKNHYPDNVFANVAIDAITVPEPVDVEANSIQGTYTPVSQALDIFSTVLAPGANVGTGYGALASGDYYTGLTYDDAGGLRYLLSTNNLNFENPAPGSQLEVTNFTLQVLQTSDLASLMEFSKTNPPAAVLAQFPGIEISSFSSTPVVVEVPNVVSYFTNVTGGVAGSTEFVVKTNGFTPTLQTNYAYTFDNVIIVHEHTNTTAQLQTTTIGPPVGSPVDTPPITTVTTKKIVLTNVISGDYYIIPPGSCGLDIVSTLVSNNLAGITTNIITTATGVTTNGSAVTAFQSIVTYFTNNWYEYYACTFETPPGPALYQGVGKISFVKANYDSLTGQFFNPVTNFYSMVTVTNSRPVVQHFMRIVTQPDILLDAVDLASPNVSQIGTGFPPFGRSIAFTQNPLVPGATAQSGPGTITDYPMTISYNSAGGVYYIPGSEANGQNAFLTTQPSLFTWASFDNSTNAPIIYPDGSSLSNLQNQILIQISPTALPDATNNIAYSQTFTTTGGSFTPPYTWSLGINQSTQTQTVLPAGLTLSSGGTISGTPVGDPDGTYDFVLEMTDYVGRSITWNYQINIDQ